MKLARLLRYRRRERQTPPQRLRCVEILPSGQQCPHLARRGTDRCRYHPGGAG